MSGDGPVIGLLSGGSADQSPAKQSGVHRADRLCERTLSQKNASFHLRLVTQVHHTLSLGSGRHSKHLLQGTSRARVTSSGEMAVVLFWTNADIVDGLR